MESSFKSTFVGLLHVQAVENEPGRFQVGNKPYLVDLAENRGIGWCGCPDMEFNRKITEGLLEKGLETDVEGIDRFRCKHIKAARTALGLFLVDRTVSLLLRQNAEP